jgi:Domain of unknown function (DUF4404)
MNGPQEASLREMLRRLHERLSRADPLDGESRRLLAALTGDIERALGAGGRGASLQQDSLPRLEALAVRFETEHPTLAEVLRQLIEALGKAGI